MNSKHQMCDVEIIHAGDAPQYSSAGEHTRPHYRVNQSAHERSSFNRTVLYGFAAILSGSIHALLFGSAFIGYAPRHIKTPLVEGAAHIVGDSTAGESLTMILIPDETTVSSSEEPPEFIATATATAERMLDVPTLVSSDAVRDPQPMLDGVNDGDETAAKVGDQTGLAMLFGRYMGQVKARVERAWEYPAKRYRATFSCRASIKQDKNGNVEEVMLQRCDSDPAWQMSLVQAIQRASPLSAPPDEKVFTPTVTLNFDVR